MPLITPIKLSYPERGTINKWGLRGDTFDAITRRLQTAPESNMALLENKIAQVVAEIKTSKYRERTSTQVAVGVLSPRRETGEANRMTIQNRSRVVASLQNKALNKENGALLSEEQRICTIDLLDKFLEWEREIIYWAEIAEDNVEETLRKAYTSYAVWQDKKAARWETIGTVVAAATTALIPPPIGIMTGAAVKSACGSVTGNWENVVEGGASTIAKEVASELLPYPIHTVVHGLYTTERFVHKVMAGDHITSSTTHPTIISRGSSEITQAIIGEFRKKIATMFSFIDIDLNEYIKDSKNLTAVLWAVWKHEKLELRDAAAGKENPREYIEDKLVEHSLCYLNTMVHNELIRLAKMAKRSTKMDEGKVKHEFEILLWAQYLSTEGRIQQTAEDVQKASPFFDRGDRWRGEAIWVRVFTFGVVKKELCTKPFYNALSRLGIVQHYEGRDENYTNAVEQWFPDQRRYVPYNKEGGYRSRSRLAAWAVEYMERPPKELLKAIFGI
ncbi:MAG: hypothetical protein BWK79_19065 [Beggiatoa sp. IS2]|nr:MAG: hypothetical protein BWK79_19065 [Beggiatoa sp. IS2]